ncbi:hypothetical protein OsJ_35859 [Oryza sativa Japonica Group]|jgi:hypothetical protein|uniref:Uncharacterized protein n=1 Tax=Oryza sativa subsp. japonica TaxID=39947 RepID=A3CGP4_ORYSJ|nr:hypothetical protein OsJ_35859 [Oryza sativa Japonica Group]
MRKACADPNSTQLLQTANALGASSSKALSITKVREQGTMVRVEALKNRVTDEWHGALVQSRVWTFEPAYDGISEPKCA